MGQIPGPQNCWARDVQSPISLWLPVRSLQNLGNEPGTWKISGLINRESVPVGIPLWFFVWVAWFVACPKECTALGVSGSCCHIHLLMVAGGWMPSQWYGFEFK